MLLKLSLAFTIVPFIEIYLLLRIRSHLEALNTVIPVILTRLFDALLALFQGVRTMIKVGESLMNSSGI